jgi:hypothetical protein
MKPKPDYELEVLLNLDRHEFNFARTISSSTKCAGSWLRKAVRQGSNIASRSTTRSERGFTELITHTGRGGDTNLTTAIHMDRPSLSLMNIAVRWSCLKTSSAKSRES